MKNQDDKYDNRPANQTEHVGNGVFIVTKRDEDGEVAQQWTAEFRSLSDLIRRYDSERSP
ncbi:hypothetical protein KY311_00735 [Candidatus Woesearchaeota archaeon]|nr:hypothetical protein [Candidatus Woesearchaeota archaeon]